MIRVWSTWLAAAIFVAGVGGFFIHHLEFLRVVFSVMMVGAPQ